MTDLRKAAEAAIEAFEVVLKHHTNDKNGDNEAYAISALEALRAALAQQEPFQPDWDRINALEESLREHMAEIHRLKALAQPEQLVVGGDNLPTLTKWTPQRKPLTEDVLMAEFAKLYKSDAAILHLAENNKDYTLESIGARHHWTAFKSGARAIERAHGIGGEE